MWKIIEKKYEVKENVKRSNYVKRGAHIIKGGISYVIIMSAVTKLLSYSRHDINI